MTVLFVAFEFPPLASAGVQRSIQFAKYLPEYGIKPVVITTDKASFESMMDHPLDEGRLSDLPRNLAVERIPCNYRPPRATGKVATWARIFFSTVEPLGRHWGRTVY